MDYACRRLKYSFSDPSSLLGISTIVANPAKRDGLRVWMPDSYQAPQIAAPHFAPDFL